MKSKNKIITTTSLLATLLLSHPAAVWAQEKPEAKEAAPSAAKDAAQPLAQLAGKDAAKPAAIFQKPGLLTSVGQSSDIVVVKTLLNTRLKMGLDVKTMAQPEDLAGIKTLLVVLGASTKGMGAAGLNLDKEMDRARALVKTAKDKGIDILALHVGGESRRGKTTSDLSEIVIPSAKYVVVLESGNKDKDFTNIAAKGSAGITEAAKLADVGDAIKALFKE